MSEDNKQAEQKLEKLFAEFLEKINEKFEVSGNNLQGLGKWMTDQLRKIEREVKTLSVKNEVLDIAVSSLVQLLEEKGVLSPGEYKEKANKIYTEARIDVKKTPVKD